MDDVERAADRIATRVAEGLPIVCFTGAGISQESGIPTFRGESGLWAERDPELVATAEALERDPEAVWRFHEELRAMCREADPNAAHMALAWMETAVAERAPAPVITQNIDGLHQAAGSSNVIELHGNAGRVRCTACEFVSEDLPERFDRLPPLCECGAILRPDVVWFGEQLPRQAMEDAQRWSRLAGVMLIVGTSATVQPAASLPVMAFRSGAVLIEVNPEATALSAVVDVSLRGPAGEVMPELVEELSSELAD